MEISPATRISLSRIAPLPNNFPPQGPDSSLRKLDGNGKYGRYLPLPMICSKFAIHERCCVTQYHDDMLGVTDEYTVWSDPTGIGLGNVIL